MDRDFLLTHTALVPTLDMKCHDEFPYEAHNFYSYQLVCFYILIWGLHSAAQNMGLANGSWQVEPVDGATAWGGAKEGGWRRGGALLAIY